VGWQLQCVAPLLSPGADASRSSALRRRARQLDREGAPGARLADQRDAAAVGLDDLPADPQAQTEPAELLPGDSPFEALEDAGLIRRVDPDAVVPDLEEHVLGPPLQPDLDGLAGTVLGRVADQVVDEL